MGTHSKTTLAETSMTDDQVPGLTWVISVVPDTDCTDGTDMYEGYGSLWQWAIVTVTPVIDGHAYKGAHGTTIGWGHMRNRKGFMVRESIDDLMVGSRWYIYEGGPARADSYEHVPPPIVPVLISQASEALPDVIMKHVREAVAVADLITEARLEYLRAELRAERISYGELAELQSLAPHIKDGDVELLEAAGVPESPHHHGQVVITITANVPYEITEDALISNIEIALEGMRVPSPGGTHPFIEVLENVDVREIEDARTVYGA